MASTWDPEAWGALQSAELTLQPRAQRSRNEEATRLGSVRSGLGRFGVLGHTAGFVNGQADPRVITELY